ncbi:MAG: DUF624 domain-containing protein [Firmicutes bacterium]|nr:DUF624 domain-containing protein [Bacillota bacterium]
MFSLDSKFMRGMSRIADLVILNLVYLLTCVPIVTVGAANAALYTVCFRLGTEAEGSTVKDYFRAFRENFRQGTLLWLLFLLVGSAACVDILLFSRLEGWMRWLSALFVVALILVVMMFSYVFPLLSQFQNGCKSTLKNALLLSVGYLPRTLLIGVLNVLPWVVMLTNLYLFLQAGILWLVFYFSAAAYLNACLLRKVFAPYKHEEEAA